MFLYIGGVPGVGKSTIIKKLKDKLAQEKIKTGVITGAPILRKLAQLKNIEELRQLSEEERKRLRPKMYNIIYSILKKNPNTFWIFDGHFCYFDWNGKKFGIRSIQSWDKKLMTGIIILIAKPKTILLRRIKDKRPDRKLTLNFIKKELKKESEIAKLQAIKLQKPLIFIANENGEAEKNSEKILQFIKKLRQKTDYLFSNSTMR